MFDMTRPTRADLAIAICIYLQTVLVAPALTVVVAEDGQVTIESETAHLAKWHAQSARAGEAPPEVRGAGWTLADTACGHQHFRFAESSSRRCEAEPLTTATPSPAPLPPVPGDQAATCGVLRRRGEPPPDGRCTASCAAFDAAVLTI